MWQEVSDQTVSTWFPKCGFRNKAQDGVVQTLDQDEDEEFANLVKELAGDVDPDNFVNFDKDNSFSMSYISVDGMSYITLVRTLHLDRLPCVGFPKTCAKS